MGYIDYVNVLQGTNSTMRFSNGNTLPLTQMPFGMAAFAPQTNGGSDWWFQPGSHSLEGIRLTHQPSPWIHDYGTLLITPQADAIMDDYLQGWSGYQIEKSVFTPHYIKTKFLRSRANFELAPTMRGASVRVAFDNLWSSCISLFNIRGNVDFQIDKENQCVYGWTDGAVANPKDFKMFFVLRPKTDWIDYDRCRLFQCKNENAGIHIALREGTCTCEFDIAISYISFNQARLNLREMQGKSLEDVKELAGEAWEQYLSSIMIQTEDEKELKTFYSCMYRTGLFPHAAHEITEEGKVVHYSPYTGEVSEGVKYTDNGFWDTYRTAFPLYALIKPQLYSDVLKSVLSDYREGGWLPRWLAMGEVGCMPSTLIDSVIAQGVMLTLVDEDTARALMQAMLHHSKHASKQSKYGREGIAEYNRLGWVPCDSHAESVNLTLDYAYGDYCIAVIAKQLGEEEIYSEYMARANNYQNIFDKESGFMRAKLANGTFREDFDPMQWGRDYTEACAWQTTFSVPHDLEGLANCMGGADKLLQKLDDLFAQKPLYRVGGYGKEIHEMTEMAVAELGLCAISNQPSFSLPFLYAYFGENQKTEELVNQICKEYFDSGINGFPGDEDNGSMAAWYILSTIGLYPVCPGDNRWIHIKPRFPYEIAVSEKR